MFQKLGDFIRDVAYTAFDDANEQYKNGDHEAHARAFDRSRNLQVAANLLDPKRQYEFQERYDWENQADDV